MTPVYLEYFGLAEAPFSIAPDPRYLFLSPAHREALAHLLYGVKSDDGFVVLTGEVGAGKTTVCRCVLEQLPEGCEVAFIFNPRLSVLELLASICEEFRIPVPEAAPGVKAYIDHLNAWLLDVHARGRMAVLIIDEAQSLDPAVLEQVRLLTNLETHRRKLLRIILLGQPQLGEILDRPDMAQLAQRVVARFHLGPLSRSEMESYVAHRLAAAGASGPIFTAGALAALYRLAAGVPRRVNVIADRALLGAYAEGRKRVDEALVDKAAGEVLGRRPAAPRRMRIAAIGLGAAGGAAAAVAAYLHFTGTAVELPARPELAAAAPAVLPAALPAAPAAGPVPVAAAPEPEIDFEPALKLPELLAAALPASQPIVAAKKPAVELLRQGNRGAAVLRLRRDLARASGAATADDPSPVFDAELAEAVRRYQAAEGLPVTGVVGPLTRERLQQATTIAGAPAAKGQ